MKIFVASNDDVARMIAHRIFSQLDSNAIITSAGIDDVEAVSGEMLKSYGGLDFVHSIKDFDNTSWTVVIEIKRLNMSGVVDTSKIISSRKYTIMLDANDSETEIERVVRGLYFDKIQYAGAACTCGANDICKCH
ncbi:MAG: hypothetical protein PHR45_06065 [Muribaculaceae bacterium]|nr:hypothetical protein [Muribaculaceae bacterium]